MKNHWQLGVLDDYQCSILMYVFILPRSRHVDRILLYLQGEHSAGLEPQVSLEVLSNLTHEPLERQLADEQLSGLLVLANLTQGDSSWPVPVCTCFLSALNWAAILNEGSSWLFVKFKPKFWVCGLVKWHPLEESSALIAVIFSPFL